MLLLTELWHCESESEVIHHNSAWSKLKVKLLQYVYLLLLSNKPLYSCWAVSVTNIVVQMSHFNVKYFRAVKKTPPSKICKSRRKTAVVFMMQAGDWSYCLVTFYISMTCITRESENCLTDFRIYRKIALLVIKGRRELLISSIEELNKVVMKWLHWKNQLNEPESIYKPIFWATGTWRSAGNARAYT